MLIFSTKRENLAETMDFQLPEFNYYYEIDDKISIVWKFDEADSQKARKYFTDIQKRLTHSIEGFIIESDEWNSIKDLYTKTKDHTNELKDFKHLKSLPYYDIGMIDTDHIHDIKRGANNKCFYAVRKTAQAMLKKQKCHGIVAPTFSKEELNQECLQYKYLAEDNSTYKSSIKSVYEWNYKNGFTTRKPSERNRVDNAKHLHKQRVAKSKSIILEASTNYYLKNKKINFSAISRIIGLGRQTIAKYFFLFIEEFKSLVGAELNKGLNLIKSMCSLRPLKASIYISISHILTPLRELSKFSQTICKKVSNKRKKVHLE